MSTTVTYKGQTLTTVENQTKTLQTAGTWVEGDFTLTDVTQGGGGEWTTEGIGKGTEPNGTITANYAIAENAFYGKNGITSVALTDGASVGNNAFFNCSNITSITSGVYCEITGSSAFQNCTGLTNVTLNGCGRIHGTAAFRQCSNLVEWRAPDCGLDKNGNEMTWNVPMGSQMFYSCTKLELVDYGHASGQFANCFFNTPLLRTLILRRVDGVCGINGWSSGAMGGIYNNPTESTIYVPQALISSYQTATNWSTAYAAGLTFLPIEGSEYEL